MTHRSYVRQQILRDAHRAKRDLRDDVDDVLRRAQESGDWPWTIDVSDLDPSICRDVARQVSALGKHQVVEVVDDDGHRALEIDRAQEERNEDAIAAIALNGSIPMAIASSRSDRLAHLCLAAIAVAGSIGLPMLLASTALMRIVVMSLELPFLIWGLQNLRRVRPFRIDGPGDSALAGGNVLPPALPAPPVPPRGTSFAP